MDDPVNLQGWGWATFLLPYVDESPLYQSVKDEAERQLYLIPGGKLPAADFQANGSQTASHKYRGFRSVHDMHPSAGDLICPVTQTKANLHCTWIVNGSSISFAVRLALMNSSSSPKSIPSKSASHEIIFRNELPSQVCA